MHFAAGDEAETSLGPAGKSVGFDELALLALLRDRDELAFTTLVDTYADAMLRTAMVFTGSRAVAEEIVQDTWIAVLSGLGQFEGRSSFKTWVFRILVNRAKTQALRDQRVVPFSVLDASSDDRVPSLPPERFLPPDHGRWPGHWSTPPESWGGEPEERLLAAEAMAAVRNAIESLPPLQRAVITLRDVEGWPAEEVCATLQLTPTNQRVLLHRARSKVRARLEQYLGSPAHPMG